MKKGLWTRRMKRQRGVLTAVDFTEGQSTTQLSVRLRMDYATVYKDLQELEKRGYVTSTCSRPVLWIRKN